jgi:DNA repair exonuclease SbcCD nuclease subunit
MATFSFVHTADLHLDSPFAAFSLNNPDLAEILKSATFEAFENVIRLCLDKDVDSLLVAGDVYDGADRSLRAQVKFRDGLKRLHDAGIRSFVVHGNHDPLDGWSSTLEWPPGVHVFGDHLETLPLERDGSLLAHIQGISYPKRDERRNLSRLFKRSDPGFHIGLLHANVGSDTGHEPYAQCSLEDLLRPEMDYWALGHVHKKKLLSHNLPYVLYPGNTQGRNFKETEEKGCYLVRVNEDKDVDVEFHATDVIRWTTRELSIRGLEREQDLINALDQLCSDLSKAEAGRPSIARISLTGSGPLYKFLRRPDAVSDLLEITQETGMSQSPFVWVEKIQLRITPELDLEARMEERDFLGDLLRYSRELSKDKHFEERVREDLALLFQDSKARRFLDFPTAMQLKDLLGEAEKICVESLHGEESE